MLKITTEGRKAALDLRLVLPHVRDNPDSKTNKAVEKILDIWQQSAPTKGAQLVFCDLSTPQANGRWFSVYDDVREKLIHGSIPQIRSRSRRTPPTTHPKRCSSNPCAREESAFFSAAQRRWAEARMSKRALSLCIISTRLATCRYRATRRPNPPPGQSKRIRECSYVTEGSFDAYMWQTLETKCRFITQVMTGDATMRRAEDVDSTALTYAEVKAIASGNPLVIEKATIDAEVMRLTRLKKQHAESLYQMRHRVRQLTDNGVILEREIANIREDLRTRVSTRGDNFAMTVKNEMFTDRVKAGRALVFAAAAIKPFESMKAIGSIGGFPISIERFDERATVLIHGKHSYRANVSDSPTGTIASLEHALDSIEDRLRERETDLVQSRRQIVDLANQFEQPFEHVEKLAAAAKRQQEIVAALDITKNQASSKVGQDGALQECEALEAKPKQSVREALQRSHVVVRNS